MRIAYVVSALNTFVVNEMIGVQEAGHELVIVPLYSAPTSPVRHGTFQTTSACGNPTSRPV